MTACEIFVYGDAEECPRCGIDRDLSTEVRAYQGIYTWCDDCRYTDPVVYCLTTQPDQWDAVVVESLIELGYDILQIENLTGVDKRRISINVTKFLPHLTNSLQKFQPHEIKKLGLTEMSLQELRKYREDLSSV